VSITADILLVSPSAETKDLFRNCLSSNGFKLTPLTTAAEALGISLNKRFDLLIYDGGLHEAAAVMREIQRKNPHAKTLLIASAGGKFDPEALLRGGVGGCLFKPLREAEIRFEIHRLLAKPVLMEDTSGEDKYIHQQSRNQRMAELYNAAVEKIARSDATVLILGESGTGKELMAKWVYSHSQRKMKPFVKVSCAVLPEGVLESELFGHEKGAFTGAYTKRKGRFEMADGGTIFLDEIGDISPAIQSKFLRVLQEREFQRIGSNDTIKVDVRVIAATSRDLWSEVRAGKFREDLYYRVNVISLNIPPLRERKEDIPFLAKLFMRKYAGRAQKSLDGFDPLALKMLCDYDWPGNVRELENMVERAVVLSSQEVITPADLPVNLHKFSAQEAGGDLTLRGAREQFEGEYIRDMLERFSGNISRSAECMGIARKNLLEKLKKYGIDQNQYR